MKYLTLYYSIYIRLKGGDSMSNFFRMRGVERAPASVRRRNFFDVDGGLEWLATRLQTMFTLSVLQSKIVRALVLGSTVLVRFIMSNSQKKTAPFLYYFLRKNVQKRNAPFFFISMVGRLDVPALWMASPQNNNLGWNYGFPNG